VTAREKPRKITCPHCGEEAFLLRKSRYDGFKRVGETLSCSECGREIEAEEEPPAAAAARKLPALFSEEDRTPAVDLFSNDADRGRLCRHCRHYVLNPWRQWCGLHRRDVEATDTCARFAAREEPKPPPSA
jgi:DNA-directed RNA polymerase subunit RPC12/RpoP